MVCHHGHLLTILCGGVDSCCKGDLAAGMPFHVDTCGYNPLPNRFLVSYGRRLSPLLLMVSETACMSLSILS